MFGLTLVAGVVCGLAAVAFHLALRGTEHLLVDRAKSTINYINHHLWVGTRGPGISDDLQHSAYLGKAESKIAAVGAPA